MSKSLDKSNWGVGFSRILNEQESKALKENLQPEDVAKIVMNMNIIPIDKMYKDEKYVDRFDGHKYNPMIMRNEIRVLDAKQGGNMWLLGERFNRIQESKSYREWGYRSFEEYIDEDTEYSRSTVYAYIKIYVRYKYEDAVRCGAKLQLIPAYIQSDDERVIREMISRISELTFDEAKEYLSGIKSEKSSTPPADDEDDKVIQMVPARTGVIEPYEPKVSIFTPEKVTKDGKIVIDKKIEREAIKPYTVIYSWEKKQDKQLFEEVVQDMWKTILRRMAYKKQNQ